jgi:glutamine amidotransferase
MSNKIITIIDYGMGNIRSLQNALNYLGYDSKVTSTPEEIKTSNILILPGVGSFGQAMKNINNYGLKDVITEVVINKGIPFLGICLGMQLLADCGEEDGINSGLGLIPGKVLKFKSNKIRLPHIGFNSLKYRNKSSNIFQNIQNNSDFYFVHSFFYECQNESNIIGTTEYGDEFVSAINKDNIYGFQFHPEKSQSNGLLLLNNFIKVSEKI